MASLVAVGGVGATGTSTTAPYAAPAFNQCNGETVDVQGTMHLEVDITTSGGKTHITDKSHLSDAKGVAVVTGARYVEVHTDNSMGNFDFDFMPAEFTHVETHILNRLGEDGTTDDFQYHLNFHMTVNANGVVTADHTDSRIECR